VRGRGGAKRFEHGTIANELQHLVDPEDDVLHLQVRLRVSHSVNDNGGRAVGLLPPDALWRARLEPSIVLNFLGGCHMWQALSALPARDALRLFGYVLLFVAHIGGLPHTIISFGYGLILVSYCTEGAEEGCCAPAPRRRCRRTRQRRKAKR